jgi:outer membrane murein-binding lipoprotein Lpp
MESGREQNFWPGFVDALSNLVLTLVFVMVIFVLAMFYLSSKVSQSRMDALCPATKAELEQVKKDLQETRKALNVALAEAGQARAKIEVGELDDEAERVLDKAIAPFIESGKQAKAILNAVPGPETFSEGKRLSFFRAVAIRNYLISKGVAKANIDSKVASHDQRDQNDPDGRVVIELQRAAP